jgi:hypothetical protein
MGEMWRKHETVRNNVTKYREHMMMIHEWNGMMLHDVGVVPENQGVMGCMYA